MMGKKRALTEKERQILYLMVSKPYEKDARLAQEIGITPGAFSIIKNRMYGVHFTRGYLPDLRKIGIDLYTANIAKATVTEELSDKTLDIIEKLYRKDIYYTTTASKTIALGAFYNVYESKLTKNLIDRFYLHRPDVTSRFDYVPFTPNNLPFYEYMNFTGLIGKRIRFHDIYPDKNIYRELKPIERNFISYGCDEHYPGDEEIAGKLGVSKITTYRIRTKLMYEGIIYPMNFLSIDSLGYDHLGGMMITMNKPMMKDLMAYYNGDDKLSPILERQFIVLGDYVDLLLVGAYRDFSDWENTKEMIERWATERGHTHFTCSCEIISIKEIVDNNLANFSHVFDDMTEEMREKLLSE